MANNLSQSGGYCKKLLQCARIIQRRDREKLGMKCHPKLPSIKVGGIIVSATHLGLGVDNTIIVVFKDTAKKDTVDIPEEDRRKRCLLEVLTTEVEERRGTVRTFDTPSDSKRCDKLQQQKRSAGKVMSAAESSLITTLEAQLAVLRNMCKIAKHSGNADAINSMKRAVASFTEVKTLERKGPPA